MLLIPVAVFIWAKYKPAFKLDPSIIVSLVLGTNDNTFLPKTSNTLIDDMLTFLVLIVHESLVGFGYALNSIASKLVVPSTGAAPVISPSHEILSK